MFRKGKKCEWNIKQFAIDFILCVNIANGIEELMERFKYTWKVRLKYNVKSVGD